MPSRTRWILLAVVALAVLAGTFYFLRSRPPDQLLRASGTIEATEVEISFQIPGKVQEVLVAEGQPVKRGEAVARLSAEEIEAGSMISRSCRASKKPRCTATSCA
jgi:HlyD family secretion protein